MVVRRTKEQMQAELARLSEIFDVIREYMLREEQSADRRALIPTGAEIQAAIQDRKMTASDTIASLQQAINNHSIALEQAQQNGLSTLIDFPAFYKNRTGRNYFEDIQHPGAAARAILARGVITDETEYYLLIEYLNDTSQTIFNEDEIIRIGQMINDFETAAITQNQ